jgi:hypothetical protein
MDAWICGTAVGGRLVLTASGETITVGRLKPWVGSTTVRDGTAVGNLMGSVAVAGPGVQVGGRRLIGVGVLVGTNAMMVAATSVFISLSVRGVGAAVHAVRLIKQTLRTIPKITRDVGKQFLGNRNTLLFIISGSSQLLRLLPRKS